MKPVILFLAAMAGFLACGQPGGRPGNTAADSGQGNAEAAPDTTANGYFYLQLKGAVGEHPITMQLLQTGPTIYRGYYCYDRIGEPIAIWGSPDSSQQVKIYEDVRSNEETTFRGKLDLAQGTFEGTWRSPHASFPFSLKADFTNAIRFNVYYTIDSMPLLPNHPRSPVATATSSIVWPAAGTDNDIAMLIKKAVTGDQQPADPQALLKRGIDSFFATYRASVSDLDTTTLKDEAQSASWNWTSDGDMKVVWNQHPLLVLETNGYEYTGGAHGNGGATYQTLDLAKQKILTPDDVFRPGYKKALVPELEAAFRKQYKVPNKDAVKSWLLVDHIAPNNNFALTAKGVMFSYTPYEIGPYALGQVSLFIPYERIRGMLKEEYGK